MGGRKRSMMSSLARGAAATKPRGITDTLVILQLPSGGDSSDTGLRELAGGAPLSLIRAHISPHTSHLDHFKQQSQIISKSFQRIALDWSRTATTTGLKVNLAVKLSEAKLVFHVHAVILSSSSSSSSLLSLPLNQISSLMFLFSSPSGPSLIGCGSPKLWESGANGNRGGTWAGLSLVDLQRDAPS